MKWFAGCLLSMLFFMIIYHTTDATSLNGTVDVKYQTEHYVFRDQDTVQGFVDLCKGFTIVPATNHGSNIFMDTNVTVSGGVDLRGTSTLTLLRDLYLDEGVTFSDSGRIYSYGNALIMNGDLTIPANKVLHCGGNLIINGEGHTLHLASGSQLFLDNYATITLRNMIIETTHSFPGQSALTLSSTLSKLIFDNVNLALGDDLYINSGQLFFHNDVVVTGTSALVYRSIAPSYICSHGCLMFDHGTTFSYAPATDNKDLFLLKDASATLAFNGSSLLATHTGLRLSKGRLFFDNKVMLNSQADKYINTTTSFGTNINISTGALSGTRGLAWSPDCRYVAVIAEDNNTLFIYSFTGGTLTEVGKIETGLSLPGTVSWSPDGQYLVVGSYGTNTLTVYSVTGGVPVALGATLGATWVRAVAWSPDGRYVAAACEAAPSLVIYAFSGSVPVQVGSTTVDLDGALFVSWSPDGRYLAVASSNNNYLVIYSFSGGTPVEVGKTSTDLSSPRGVAWSPDGKYLAVPSISNNYLVIYSFSGGAPVEVGKTSTDLTSPRAVSWSPDGRYVAVASYGSDTLAVYLFYGGTPSKVGTITSGTDLDGLRLVSWSPDGGYIALTAHDSDKLVVYPVNYRPDLSSQSIDRSIVFGNSAAGATSNLDVHVLAGACVELNGDVFDDPA